MKIRLPGWCTKENYIISIISISLSVFLGYITTSVEKSGLTIDNQNSIIQQEKIRDYKTEQKIYYLYYKNRLIARVYDKDKIMQNYRKTYEKEFQNEYPESDVSLHEDLYFIEKISYQRYEDVDDEVWEYLASNKLFSIKATRITFSNGAVIYVKKRSDFDEARKKFLLNFVFTEFY